MSQPPYQPPPQPQAPYQPPSAPHQGFPPQPAGPPQGFQQPPQPPQPTAPQGPAQGFPQQQQQQQQGGFSQPPANALSPTTQGPGQAASLFGAVDQGQVAQTHQATASSGVWHKFVGGQNVMRLLPPKAGTSLREPWVVFYSHYIEVPGSERGLSINCPREMVGQPCPVCELVDQLKVSSSPLDQQRADDIGARRQVVANAINRKQPDHGPRKLRVPSGMYNFLVAAMGDPWQPVDFTNPAEAKDVGVFKTGEKKQSRYQYRFDDNKTPLAATYEQMAAWAEAMPDLREELVVSSYEQIVGQLAQVAQTGRPGPAGQLGQFGAQPQQPALGPGPQPWGGQQPPPQQGGFGQPQPPAPQPQQWDGLQQPPQPQQPPQSVVANMGTVNQNGTRNY